MIFKRTQCVLTGNKVDLQHLHTFEHFPIYMGCTTSDQKYDSFADMTWTVSPQSGSLQLSYLIDPNILYKNHHNSGSIGGIWNKHHIDFFNFIRSGNHKNILEIGGGSGTLANIFLQNSNEGNWTIIEPSAQNIVCTNRLNFIQELFENYQFTKKFDSIVHSHVMEHVSYPIEFLKKIHSLLSIGGSHYISIPNMKHWLQQGYSSTLTFEHTYYIDYNVLECLLNSNGFIIERSIVGEHSIFVKAIKTEIITNTKIELSYAKDLFKSYVKNLKDDIDIIQSKIKDQKFYLFGAHIFSQMLINLGLNENQIEYILDNDQRKQNKRLYGTKCMVKPPLCLKDVKDPIVVLRVGIYTEEIKESILKINSSAIFI